MERLCLFFVALLFSSPLIGQQLDRPIGPAQLVNHTQNQGTEFARMNDLFSVKTSSIGGRSDLQQEVRNGVLLDFNQQVAQALVEGSRQAIALDLPLPGGGTVELDLVQVDIFADGFKVKTNLEPNGMAYTPGVHYRGVVKNSPGSSASISVFGDEVMGLFTLPRAGNYVLGQLQGDNRSHEHILYNDADLTQPFEFECGTPDDGYTYREDELLPMTGRANECIKVYLEVNNDISADKGGSTGATNYITGAFNQIATLYAAENLNYQISEVFVWVGSSPYTGGSSSATLNQFKSQTSSLNGDLGHFVTYASSGGIAAGFNGLCNSNIDNSLCISDIQPTFANVPTYSWTIMVMTHEMGHLNGSRHTHACVWNGNGTAIDGCSGSTEGSCSLPGNPSGGGTIMSYCHLQSVGINLANGFGPQPGNVIRNAAAGASCLDCDGGGGGCSSTISSFPYNESFESGFGGWSNQTGDNIDWTRDANGTPSSNTGPSSASDGTFYLYTETSGNGTGYPNKTAFLQSPCIDLSGESEAYLTFGYHMYGASMGTLQLQVSANDGATWGTIWAESGDQGNAWQETTRDLSTFAGQTILVRFVGTSANSWQSDMAIDKINISNSNTGPTCTGPTFSTHLANFESNFDSWTNNTGDNLNWTRRSGGTPSVNTGPSSANLNSNYIYVESSRNGTGYPSKTAILTSPCFTISDPSSAFVDFSYHMYGASMGTLQLQVSVNNGASWGTIWTESGNQGNQWTQTTRSLTSYVGQTIKLRFFATTGSSWQSDFALDGIQVNAFFYLPEASLPAAATPLKSDFELSPNPTAHRLNLAYQLEENLPAKLRVYDPMGRLVQQAELPSVEGSNNHVLDVSALPAGTYMAVLDAEGRQVTKRFVKVD